MTNLENEIPNSANSTTDEVDANSAPDVFEPPDSNSSTTNERPNLSKIDQVTLVAIVMLSSSTKRTTLGTQSICGT